MTHGKKIHAPMLVAVRKKAADGEDRLLIRFQLAWERADRSMRIMANLDNDATFPSISLSKNPARLLDMVLRTVLYFFHMKAGIIIVLTSKITT